MTDQTAILLSVLLTAVVIALFVYNRRAKQRFEAERAERRRKLDQIKTDARRKQQAAETDNT
ncbi:MAG: hypothetical protein ACSHX3_00940 [Litorimonas sp.]